MKIKSKITKVDVDDKKSPKIRIFWVEENGRELFGPVESRQACEEFIKEEGK